MPLYSFVCPRCGNAFEELLPMSRRDEAACPRCGEAARRDLKQEGFSSKTQPDREECRFAGECPGSAGGCPGCCAR